MGRCFKSVALASEEPTQCVAVDQKPDHQIGHAFGFAKAACTAYPRLIRVRQWRCWLSIFWVWSLPTLWRSASRGRSEASPPSVSYRVMPNGSNQAFSCKKTASLRRPNLSAPTVSVPGPIACQSHRGFILRATKLHLSSSSDLNPRHTSRSSARPIFTSMYSGFKIANSA